ncbi:hypothetical protein L9F63_004964 [Diploptera punctata]|uniref:Ionotropic glutamate receptor C-terminal domain-containing protein n=1 Tax=Diploptera punctata TaxID=6984 RepID=A0AAD7ZDZ3_DIPPU|nr:hypothetical protein L9F63_004964 [Diploptera punctata]
MLLAFILNSYFLLNSKDGDVEGRHLVQCIRAIGLQHFLTSNTLVLSISGVRESQFYSDVENILTKEIHSTEIWPITISRPSDEDVSSFSDDKTHSKHGNYVILTYGQTPDEVMDDMLNKIQHLSYYAAWNPRAKFLVVVLITTNNYNASEIATNFLREMIWWKILHSTLVNLTFNTWFPYQSKDKCLNVEDVVLLDSWFVAGHEFKKNANLFPKKIRNNLHKCPFTASTFPIDLVVGPYNDTRSNSSESAYDSGMEIAMVKFITNTLNLTLKFRPPPSNDERWGRLLENGKITGLLREVVSEESDLGFGAWPLHPKLLKMNGFGGFPCAKEIPRWKGIAMVFQLQAWFCLSCSFILAVTFSMYLTKYVKNEFEGYKQIYDCIQNMWAVVLGVSLATLPRSTPLRMFFICWICYGLSINTVFQAFLTTFLIEPGHGHQISNIEEVIDTNIKYGYNKGFDIILNDSSDILAQTILANRMECQEGNIPPCLDWMAYHNNFSLLCSKALIRYILSKDYMDENGNSLICQAGGTFFPLTYVTYMTKWNPLLETFNDKITRIIENGFINIWLEIILHKQQIDGAAITKNAILGDYFDLSFGTLARNVRHSPPWTSTQCAHFHSRNFLF